MQTSPESLTPSMMRKRSMADKNVDEYNFSLSPNVGPRNKSKPGYSIMLNSRIKSNPSFSLQKLSTRSVELAKISLLPHNKRKEVFKLPAIKKSMNPEDSKHQEHQKEGISEIRHTYYQSKLYKALKKHETTYIMNLIRQHFYQNVETLRLSKGFKVPYARKDIKLPKKNPDFKTIYLDMDETLIHCDERSGNYTVKLNFPLERGGTLAAGVRIRPYCIEFLQQLSQIAEIIIFTASSASYADVVLDYLDPKHQYISHRLYRQHCTLEKGFYLKDLRIVNRPLSEVALVDNSPFCFLLQPDNGIPMVPFYHFNKDRELEDLLPFLGELVKCEDMRKMVKSTFFWDRYINEVGDPRKLFLKYYNGE